MHTNLLPKHLFIDLLWTQQTILHLLCQLPDTLDYIPPSTVIRCNIQRQPGILGSNRF